MKKQQQAMVNDMDNKLGKILQHDYQSAGK